MKTIEVAGDGFRAYEVRVGEGLLTRAGEMIAPFLPRKRCVVVTDETVGALHGPALIAALERAGVTSTVIAVPPGEASKCFSQLEDLCDRLLALDTLYIDTVVLTVLLGMRLGTELLFEAALLIAMLGFVSTVALARYVARGEVIE